LKTPRRKEIRIGTSLRKSWGAKGSPSGKGREENLATNAQSRKGGLGKKEIGKKKEKWTKTLGRKNELPQRARKTRAKEDGGSSKLGKEKDNPLYL